MAEEAPRVVPEGFKELKEGSAHILYQGNAVFYNEAMCTNRDLSVAVLRTFLPMLVAEAAAQPGKKAKRHNIKTPSGRGNVPAAPAGSTTAAPAGAAAAAACSGGGAATATPAAEASGSEGVADVAARAGAAAAAGTAASSAEYAAASAAAGVRVHRMIAERPDQNTGARPRLFEGLSASGLRAVRYAQEVPALGSIVANDLDPIAVEAIQRNLIHNGGAQLQPRSSPAAGMHASRSCRHHWRMTSWVWIQVAGEVVDLDQCADLVVVTCLSQAYDVVDLDPYGTPAMFLDSAVQSVADGGLLMVTATDMANLCGSNMSACWSLYNSFPIHRNYCHEMALRILLASIESHANRYKRHIVPLLCLSIDYYVRIFVRVYLSPGDVGNASSKLSYLWQSSGCDDFFLQPVSYKKTTSKDGFRFHPGFGPVVPGRCAETGSAFTMGGPIWSDPIHDITFVNSLVASMNADGPSSYGTFNKMKGLLAAVQEELPDVPLYYSLHDMCRTVKCQPCKRDQFMSAIINAGYRVSCTHAHQLAIKTDCPPSIMWDILRCWVKEQPSNSNLARDPESNVAKILSKEPTHIADWTRVEGVVSKAKADGIVKFVENPAYWGPKVRAGRHHKDKSGQQHESHVERDPRQGHKKAARLKREAVQAAAGQHPAAAGAGAGGHKTCKTCKTCKRMGAGEQQLAGRDRNRKVGVRSSRTQGRGAAAGEAQQRPASQQLSAVTRLRWQGMVTRRKRPGVGGGAGRRRASGSVRSRAGVEAALSDVREATRCVQTKAA
ncbi:MAG: hypothetical protein WDW36_002118 [Sanguina aurantia]